MSYAKVCGYSDIVEVYRYDGDIGNGNKRNYAKPLVQSYFSEVGKDVSRQEKLSKARSKESASRAVVAFRRLVSANLSKSDIPVLASFTYRDNMQEIAIGRADFNAFARRASEAFGSQFRYICVSEFQRRGALHFHALIWGLLPSVVADERSTRMVATLWGQGFIDLVPTDGSKKLSTYLSKYMAKNFSDPRLFGRKAYIASRNIQRPWEEKGALLSPYFFGVNERGVNLSTAELLQEREYDTQWLGRANYKRFMLNAYAKSESREGDSDAV